MLLYCTGAKELVVSGGAVAFENVSFAYEASAPVLKNVSWRVDGGKTIAFVVSRSMQIDRRLLFVAAILQSHGKTVEVVGVMHS